MFFRWQIMIRPSIKGSGAQETRNVVTFWVVCDWVEVEASLGQLRNGQSTKREESNENDNYDNKYY
jgi:hypothetical protein